MQKLSSLAFAVLVSAEVAACQQAPERPPQAPPQLPPVALRAVRSWAYQLDEIDPAAIAASDFDLVVIDYARDGSDETAFTAADVAAMRRKRDGTSRVVLAYLNIGEAEDHRFYWQRDWVRHPPAWLGQEHADARGSYQVRFWDPNWQRIVYGGPDAYLDKILRAGFDGVYLDLVDAYESYARARPQAEREMVAFVRDLSRYAKARRSGAFHVFAQNAEPLVTHREFLGAVDGLGKEELYYGYDGSSTFTPPDETEFSLEFLARARDAGKVVLTVDYASDAAVVAQVYRRARAQRLVPYCTTRALDRLTVNRGFDPVSQRGAGPERRRLLPGQFFAITAPPGVMRTNLSVDSWRESVDDATAGGDAAGALRTWTVAPTLAYGLPHGWEVGARVPVVSGRLAGVAGDASRSTGLGNVTLLASRGWSADEGDRNVLASVEVDVPTDTRTAEFRSGAEARVSLTGERYRGRVGVIGSVGASAQAGGGFAASHAALDASVGVGLAASERLFGAVHVAGERGATHAEVDAELLLARDTSIELFVGRDLSGRARASFFGAALNLWRDTAWRRRTPQ